MENFEGPTEGHIKRKLLWTSLGIILLGGAVSIRNYLMKGGSQGILRHKSRPVITPISHPTDFQSHYIEVMEPATEFSDEE